MRCFCLPYRNTVTEVTQIVWRTASNCCEWSLASFRLRLVLLLSLHCIWVSLFSLPSFAANLFFSIYPSFLLPRHWNGFWNEILQITIFQTTAMCFLHMRCYRSNRAIIHPPAVSYRMRCINLAWHVRPGISFMLSVPVLVDWCNCKLVCKWISLVLLLLLFFLFDGGQWRGVSECPGRWLTVCHVRILPVIQIRFLQIPFWKLNPHSH